MAKGLRFVWDSTKAESNYRKHGISFAEAATVFADVLSLTILDPDHGQGDEVREITIGQSIKFRIVVVSHTDRDGRVRIISARKADRQESKQYNEEK